MFKRNALILEILIWLAMIGAGILVSQCAVDPNVLAVLVFVLSSLYLLAARHPTPKSKHETFRDELLNIFRFSRITSTVARFFRFVQYFGMSALLLGLLFRVLYWEGGVELQFFGLATTGIGVVMFCILFIRRSTDLARGMIFRGLAMIGLSWGVSYAKAQPEGIGLACHCAEIVEYRRSVPVDDRDPVEVKRILESCWDIEQD